LPGTARKVLSDLQLLNYFAGVYGFGALFYGCHDYDEGLSVSKAPPEVRTHLSGPEYVFQETKCLLVDKLLNMWGLQRQHAVLVEDDIREINFAQPVCRTLWVRQREGIREPHIRKLQQMTLGRGHCGGGCLAGLCPIMHVSV